jgi:hypothetical protein
MRQAKVARCKAAFDYYSIDLVKDFPKIATDEIKRVVRERLEAGANFQRIICEIHEMPIYPTVNTWAEAGEPDQPYSRCLLCGKTFDRASSTLNHISTKHGIKHRRCR